MDVDRWLLVHLPTWQLFLLFGVGVECVAIGVMVAVRKLLPGDLGSRRESLTLTLTLIAGVYGILLGLVVVTLWTSYDQAAENVSHEATTLAQLTRMTRVGFDAGAQRRIDTAARAYVTDLDTRAWPAMQQGRDPGAGELTAVYAAVASIRPHGEAQDAAYQEMTHLLTELTDDNRTRGSDATTAIPLALEVLILVSAGAVYLCLILVAGESRWLDAFVVVAVTEVLALTLLLALLLEYPFSGSVHVSPEDFHRGILASVLGSR